MAASVLIHAKPSSCDWRRYGLELVMAGAELEQSGARGRRSQPSHARYVGSRAPSFGDRRRIARRNPYPRGGVHGDFYLEDQPVTVEPPVANDCSAHRLVPGLDPAEIANDVGLERETIEADRLRVGFDAAEFPRRLYPASRPRTVDGHGRLISIRTRSKRERARLGGPWGADDRSSHRTHPIRRSCLRSRVASARDEGAANDDPSWIDTRAPKVESPIHRKAFR